MKKEFVNPDGVFAHPHYTGVVTVTDPKTFHFIAGRCASDEEYNCVAPGDYLLQYRKVMENLDIELRALGAGWGDIVFRRMYTLDVDRFLAVYDDPEATRYWTPGKHPPSTLIGVTRLSNPDFLIEMDLLAVVG